MVFLMLRPSKQDKKKKSGESYPVCQCADSPDGHTTLSIMGLTVKSLKGQSGVNALVRTMNHKYIHHSGFALVLYVLVVTHSCIIYSILPCLVASSPGPFPALQHAILKTAGNGAGNGPGDEATAWGVLTIT